VAVDTTCWLHPHGDGERIETFVGFPLPPSDRVSNATA